MSSNSATYFAYGSNLNQDRLEARVGRVNVFGTGILREHEFSYSAGRYGLDYKHPASRFYANIRKLEGSGPVQKARVWGAIYNLTEEQLHTLDQFEGHNQHDLGYERVERYVKLEKNLAAKLGLKGEHIRCWTYIARPAYTWETHEHYPTTDYVYHILKGANEHGIDRRYITKYIIDRSSTPPYANNK